MKNRITANSENLKKTFPHAYEDLFSKSSIVVSAPGSFWWTGEHSVLYGHLGINQKIPLRAYVGLEPTNTKKISIGNLLEYVPEEKKYIEYTQDDTIREKLLSIISNLHKSRTRGVKIHVITEIPRSTGLNSSGAFSSALIIALELNYDKITPKHIQNWELVPLEKLTKLEKYRFRHIFKKAWKVECIFHGDIASGSTVLAPMISGNYPLVYLPPNMSKAMEEKNILWKDKYAFVDKLNFEAYRLNELFDVPPLPIWPIDVALIYSGDTRSTASAIMSTFHRKNELIKVEKELKKVSKNKSGHFKNALLPQNMSKQHKNDNFFNIYLNNLQTISAEVLLSLKELFVEGSSPETLNKFFIALKKNNELLKYIVPTSKTINIICNEFEKEEAGYKITGGGGKGDVLIALPFRYLEFRIESLLKSISQKTGEIIYLDYASWIDKEEHNSIKIEQDLKNSINSKYISEGAVQIKTMPSEDLVVSSLITKEEFAKTKKSMELLLDKTNGKIYIKGKEISSKNLPSTKMTINVLRILLDKLGKEVKNTSFGQKSYFVDRNELQSKIISPLNKVLKKKIKKELPIEIHGSLDEFSIKLAGLPFSIRYIEKIF